MGVADFSHDIFSGLSEDNEVVRTLHCFSIRTSPDTKRPKCFKNKYDTCVLNVLYVLLRTSPVEYWPGHQLSIMQNQQGPQWSVQWCYINQRKCAVYKIAEMFHTGSGYSQLSGRRDWPFSRKLKHIIGGVGRNSGIYFEHFTSDQSVLRSAAATVR